MTTFTIDSENNITAFGTPEEAAATTTTPFDTFASQQATRGIGRRMAGGAPRGDLEQPGGSGGGGEFQERENGGRPHLDAYPEPRGHAAKPKANKKAKGGAQATKGAPAKGKSTKKATAAKNAPKAKKSAKAREAAAPREGSKTDIILGLLRRAKGASLVEIMEAASWQAHSSADSSPGLSGRRWD